MSRIHFTDGPLAGQFLSNIPVDTDKPSLIRMTRQDEGGQTLVGQGEYVFVRQPVEKRELMEGEPEQPAFVVVAKHVAGDNDMEFAPLIAPAPVVAESPERPDPIAALVAQYLAIQKIRPQQSAKLRPRFIEHLKSKGATDPESLLPE